MSGCLLFSGAALTMGGDGSNQTPPTCPRGQVYDSKTQTCMVDKGGRIGDADRTSYAYALAKSGRYQEAIDVLNTLKDPSTAVALNYRGYATRKLGRTDERIGYYLKLAALVPKSPKVHEYLGEAYMLKSRPDLAAAIVHQPES
ncbi:tetratricopeptide repeat protein [Serratia marcescens]|uniref:tetratricopeptide repeat protein n=1 Tax=Serratia marcescens TaxID=615 RepID=UPI003A4E0A85